MPDITMCANEKCPLRDGCYRYTCEPSKFQSWSMFIPKYRMSTDVVTGFKYRVYNCEHHWEVGP